MSINRQFIFSFIRIGVGVGLLMYLGLSGVIDWSILLNLAEAWPITLLAFLILILDLGVTSYRLCVLMKPHGLNLPLSASMRLTFIGHYSELQRGRDLQSLRNLEVIFKNFSSTPIIASQAL